MARSRARAAELRARERDDRAHEAAGDVRCVSCARWFAPAALTPEGYCRPCCDPRATGFSFFSPINEGGRL